MRLSHHLLSPHFLLTLAPALHCAPAAQPPAPCIASHRIICRHSCGGATEDITVELGGSQTVSQTTTVSTTAGITIPDVLSIGGGVETSNSKESTVSKTISFAIPSGKQAVFVAGTAYQSQTGNIQVNYGDRQFDHFIVSGALRALSRRGWSASDAVWYIPASVVHWRDYHEVDSYS